MTTVTKPLKNYLVAGAFVALFVGVMGGWLWWSSRQFDLPADHWIAKAKHEARDWADDAELSIIEGHYVSPDGVADMPEPGSSGWRVVFRSEALANRPPSSPAESTIPGAPSPPKTPSYACFAYTVGRGSGRQGNLVRARGGSIRCPVAQQQSAPTPPRCSVQEIWRKAEQLGAPNPGYAKIEASVRDDGWRWSFQIADHVDLELPDDC